MGIWPGHGFNVGPLEYEPRMLIIELWHSVMKLTLFDKYKFAAGKVIVLWL
jgi:hypothetical protein